MGGFMDSKDERLKTLRSEIIKEYYDVQWKDVWFYPVGEEIPDRPGCKDVKGYGGTDDIFFLALNPSTGMFPSKGDIFYYEQLKEYGFESAHLTDLFKLRMSDKMATDLVTRIKRGADPQLL